MSKILILGANGQIARVATDLFLKTTDAELTLYLRNAKRLPVPIDRRHVRVVEADVLDQKALEAAMQGQDAVYANLAGRLEQQAHAILKAMQGTGIKRLIFISSMGIYDEIPGQRYEHGPRPIPQGGCRDRGLGRRLHDPAARVAERPR